MDVVEGFANALHPAAPTTREETGLSFDLLIGLILRTVQGAAEMTGAELSRRLGLAFSVLDPGLQYLKAQRQLEVIGGSMIGGATLRYRLTDSGHTRALASFDRTMYTGPAPVPITQYRAYMARYKQQVHHRVTQENVREAFSDLVVSDRVLDEIGLAVNTGHSLFLYGPPGNGKSLMAQTVRRLLTGTIVVPYAIEVRDQVIRFYDPAHHERIDGATVDHDPVDAVDLGEHRDGRWVECRRPMVTVAGELSLESLALAYNPRSGVYTAPVQAIANGGVLVIDDFGRQQCSPRDLLNWWMAPLEARTEYLSLGSGEKFEMPFDVMVIFSTNIKPQDLVDEAFLRRIRHKIYAESPSPKSYAKIFERCCREQNLAYDPALVDQLMTSVYRLRGIEPRACHPRDLIMQALSLAEYRRMERRLTPELLKWASAGYFLDERVSVPDPPRT